jgi:hypothetical protein
MCAEEQALFAGPSVALRAGKDLASAPTVATDTLYQLQLLPQATVAFAIAPGKSIPPDGVYAGLATLKLAQPGHHYRVALDLPFWIDVVPTASSPWPSTSRDSAAVTPPTRSSNLTWMAPRMWYCN